MALGCSLIVGGPAQAAGDQAGGLRLQVMETARSVDLSRPKPESFLTVTIEITGAEPAPLRRVQPFREDFHLQAGKAELPCRWLRGGSLPDDPARLRFTLGFTPPARGTKTVSLIANLPRLESETALEVRLADLKPGFTAQERRGEGWTLSVEGFGEEPYTSPTLPAKGQYMSKGGPADVRVFRKATPGAAVPARAITLRVWSHTVELFDPTLDVTGRLIVDSGAAPALLSAVLKRNPSRSVKDPPFPPFVQGEFHFPVPPGRATGVVLQLHRRPQDPKAQPLRIDGLPVPEG